ncbi:GNAT family N-acetyltransferase [Wenxinia saemankumensis]|uniref:GNAT family N-acetyltransferase n=1 Tax=Wenxinia saemankumensis TaxID=1447782 RepID=UPI0009339488|nr:GNAT family N-acetyltransferase [Wenxinia saemankumensis]
MRVEETRDLTHPRAIRRTVFIEEQRVPEAEEWDGLDGEAIQLVAFDGDRAVGTARILTGDGYGKIGRVAVLKEGRGLGTGAALMRAAIERLRATPGIREARLGAQTHALGFYERLGFVAHGEEYDDAGIPHRNMTLRF